MTPIYKSTFRHPQSYLIAGKIKQYFIDVYDIDMSIENREAPRVKLKRMFIKYMRDELDESVKAIGKFINLNHSSVSVGYHRFNEELKQGSPAEEEYLKLKYFIEKDEIMPRNDEAESWLHQKLNRYSDENTSLIDRVEYYKKQVADSQRLLRDTVITKTKLEKKHRELTLDYTNLKREYKEMWNLKYKR